MKEEVDFSYIAPDPREKDIYVEKGKGRVCLLCQEFVPQERWPWLGVCKVQGRAVVHPTSVCELFIKQQEGVSK